MNTYRIEAKVDGMTEPMVDWYDAETQDEALKLWDEDAHRYGLPMNKTTVSIRLASRQTH